MGPSDVPFAGHEPAVYFARRSSDGAIKIGTTCHLRERVRMLGQQGRPKVTLLAWVWGGRAAERALHTRFAADHLGGEFFRPSPAVLHAVAEHEALGSAPASELDLYLSAGA